MNEKQAAFLFTLRSSIEQAQESRNRIIAGLEIGAVQSPDSCFEYIDFLDKYISSALTMAWQCQCAYGENSRTIAQSLNLRISES